MLDTPLDIAPILDENEDIGPALRPKLLEVLRNPQKCAYLHIELAAVVDWGEPFVKACYFLEGDGPFWLLIVTKLLTIF